MNRREAVLLIGPTGSGKTPLGELIERKGLWGRACRHFDFGCRLRRIFAGEEPADYLTQEDIEFIGVVLQTGALLENEHFPIAGEILRRFIAERCAGEGDLVVLNGLPRHAGQAEDVASIVDVRAVILLSCRPEIVLERIRTNAGGDRAGRADDDAESVRSRMDIFTRRIAPLVEYYRRRGVRVETIEVNADAGPEDVWKKLNARTNPLDT